MTRIIKGKESFRVGVISDTHGKLPSEVAEFFNGADLIIHAGDIGGQAILEALERIAPVVAVRGNTDFDEWAFELNPLETIQMGNVLIYVTHDLQRLNLLGMAVPHTVIHGHSHQPSAKRKKNILFLNPGSAVDPRRGASASLALLNITGDSLDIEFITLP